MLEHRNEKRSNCKLLVELTIRMPKNEIKKATKDRTLVAIILRINEPLKYLYQ